MSTYEAGEKPRTARIKIRVVLSATGEWAAWGYGTGSRHCPLEECNEVLEDMQSAWDSSEGTPQRYVWITADVQLPAPDETLKGRVEQSEP